MYNFELYNPTKIVFGEDGRRTIGKSIAKKWKRVLLVYGGNSIKRSGLYNEIKELLEAEELEIIELNGVQSNPRRNLVNYGGQLCRERDAEIVLAVGGGSVIDCGKAIALAAYYDGDYWDIVDKRIIPTKALPLITISTLSGTGTEMNNSCVITNEDLKVKRGYNCELIRPMVSYLDPKLTYSVNAYQTACGVADTLSHILDTAYMVKGDKMFMLNDVMESISRTVIKYGPIAIREPDNYEARSNLMWAATWGLNGFLKNGIKQLAACHAIEHELSARFDITHGLGMAMIMPAYYEYILNETNAHLYAQFAKNVFKVGADMTEYDAAKAMIMNLRKFLFEDLGLQSKLSEVGVDRQQFEMIAQNICWGGTLPGLETVSTEDVVNILENAF